MSSAQTSRDERVRGLIRAGELLVSGGSPEEVEAYFSADFRFHGPGGMEADYAGLQDYFASVRAAFDDRTITRGITVVEGEHIACQTTIAGRFVREFTQSPAGALAANGQRVAFEMINIFRYDGDGRLAEEWVQIDNRSLLAQLGAEGR